MTEKTKPTPKTDVTLTEKAAHAFKAIVARENLPAETGMRLGLKGGGCSGFEYRIDTCSKATPDDKVFESHGVTIYVDKKSFLFLVGVTIDYEESLLKRGFVFTNPNATGTCGCGTSFSV